MKKLGIIGGMGPLATARLFEMIVEMTKSDSDSGHIRTLIDCNSDIPDRTRAILGGGESPVPEIVKTAKGLIASGAGVLLLACNTSHYYFEDIRQQLDAETPCAVEKPTETGSLDAKGKVLLINLIEETGRAVLEKGMNSVGVLATRGAVEGRVFEKYLTPMGIGVIYPDPDGQNVVNSVIYDAVKAGRRPDDRLAGDFCDVCRGLAGRGAQAIILGCTEIPIAMEEAGLCEKLKDITFFDSLQILAAAGIREAGKDWGKA
ncbi:MAG: aspartate/glutamate racemase family protein [Lachnospiraceae bacterium]|nr:aspartate/glutamate racemase family protein [Lachnospiraceae bacterium]